MDDVDRPAGLDAARRAWGDIVVTDAGAGELVTKEPRPRAARRSCRD